MMAIFRSYQKSFYLLYLSGIGFILLLLILYPLSYFDISFLSHQERVSYRQFVDLIHKGQWQWSFFSKQKGWNDFSWYVLESDRENFNKIEMPETIIENDLLLFREHSKGRLKSGLIYVLFKKPENFSWICSHYKTPINRRLYHISTPVGLKNAGSYIEDIPINDKKMMQKRIETKEGSVFLYSFICSGVSHV
jgi:hypothetical protein